MSLEARRAEPVVTSEAIVPVARLACAPWAFQAAGVCWRAAFHPLWFKCEEETVIWPIGFGAVHHFWLAVLGLCHASRAAGGGWRAGPDQGCLGKGGRRGRVFADWQLLVDDLLTIFCGWMKTLRIFDFWQLFL